MKEDKELIELLINEFRQARERNLVNWSEEELLRMARDLARAIQKERYYRRQLNI